MYIPLRRSIVYALTKLQLSFLKTKAKLASNGHILYEYDKHVFGHRLNSLLMRDDKRGALNLARELVNQCRGSSVEGDVLTWAALGSYFEVIDLLLEAGVSIDVINSRGYSTLEFATVSYKSEAAVYLMRKGANPSLKTNSKKRFTALNCAAIQGDGDLVLAMIDFGANLEDVTGLSVRSLYRTQGYILHYIRDAGGVFPDEIEELLDLELAHKPSMNV